MLGIAVYLGVQPSEFWRMTPLEFEAVFDFRVELADRTAAPGYMSADERIELHDQMLEMMARFPDAPKPQ